MADEDSAPARRLALSCPGQFPTYPAMADAAQVFGPVAGASERATHGSEAVAEDGGLATKEEDAVGRFCEAGIRIARREPAQAHAEGEWPQIGTHANHAVPSTPAYANKSATRQVKPGT